jgi:hypothetical protein
MAAFASPHLSFQLSAIACLVIFGAAYETAIACYGHAPSNAYHYLWTATFSYLVAWLIEADRKQKSISAPFEYAGLMFFLWPLMAPYYFVQTQGWKGLGLGIALIALTFTPAITTLIVLIFIA